MPHNADDISLTTESLNQWLDHHGKWTPGVITAMRAERIGLEFGLSGRSIRLHVMTERGSRSLVAKTEPIDKISRAIAFRQHNEAALSDLIPGSYGWHLDEKIGRGVILLEDISPATQGDDLKGCSPAQARSLIRAIARLHATTWTDAGGAGDISLQGWATKPWSTERWRSRLSEATKRYPEVFATELVERLSRFPEEVDAAQAELARGPRSWVHHDPHLDNVLWRSDGSIVLLDWSGATLAPPAMDVAGLLVGLAFRRDAPLGPDQVLDEYATALNGHGMSVDRATQRDTAMMGLRLLLRGMIGWTGLADGDPPSGRALALRDGAGQRVLLAFRWLDL